MRSGLRPAALKAAATAYIQTHLPLALGIGFSLLVIALAILGLHRSIQALTLRLDAYANAKMQMIGAALNSKIASSLDLLATQAKSPLVRGSLADNQGYEAYLRPEFTSVIASNPQFTDLGLRPGAAHDGIVVSPRNEMPLEIPDAVINRVMASGTPSYTWEGGTSLMAVLPVLFPPTGTHEGVLVARIDLKPFIEQTLKATLATTPDLVDATLALTATSTQTSNAQVERFFILPEQNSVFSGTVPLPPPLDHLAADIRVKASTGTERNAILQTILLYALTALLGTITVLWVARWLELRYVRPIRRMTEILDATVAARHTEIRAKTLREGDELRALDDAVWQLIATLSLSERTFDETTKRTAEELSTTRARLEAIALNAQIAACSVALPSGVLEYASRTLTQQLHLDAQDRIHWRDICRALPHAGRQRLVRCIRDAWAAGSASCHLDFGHRVFMVRLTLAESAGAPPRMDAIAFDDTARAQAEQALALSESRKASIINGALDGFVTVNVNGLITEVNPAAECMFWRPRSELLGASLARDCISEDSRAAFTELLRQRLAGVNAGQPARLSGLRRGTQPFPIEIQATAVETAAGTELCLYVRDLSEAVAQEQAIRVQTEKLESIFDLSPDGFAYFDGQGNLTGFNPALCTLFGVESQALVAITRDGLWDLVMRKNRTGRSTLPPLGDQGEAIIQTRGEPGRVLKCAWRRRELGDGHAGHVYYFRDITTEAELDRMKSEFLATAAHELRTPMTVILGFSELLVREGIEPEEARDMLGSIRDQAVWLKSLLDDLLDLARIESMGRGVLKVKDLDLAQFVEEVVHGLAREQNGKLYVNGVEVRLHTDAGLAVRADPEKLHQAFNNLVSNGVKYGNGLPVDVRVSLAGRGRVRFSVKDRGIGMSADDIAHAFVRFWRADKSGHTPGTGLGLALVKEIAELHDGRAMLESGGNGHGTLAILELPLAPAHPRPVA